MTTAVSEQDIRYLLELAMKIYGRHVYDQLHRWH